VQLYTALVYRGPGLIEAIKNGLRRRLEEERLSSLGSAAGRDAARIAKGDLT
jgi:dihydroorotate dehydrogenase